jgi:UDP-glucose:(heptosyl)LPS alpha-1,3-glucosyltransferase
VLDKHLKVAVLIRHYSASAGGAERYCVELTKRLAKIYDVHVFTQHNSEQSDNITFHHIPQWFQRPRYLNQLLFSWFTRRVTQDKFNIVHSHEMVTHANIYTLHVPCVKTKWTNKKGLAKFLYFLDTLLSPRMLYYLWLENSEMKISKHRHFISVSEYLSRNILMNYPKIDKHIIIAYPGVNSSTEVQSNSLAKFNNLKKELELNQDDFLFLFVGNDLIKKGFLVIIQALAILNNNHIHIAIAGTGKRSKMNIPNVLENNIHFLGVVKNMTNLYQNVDALIHPTLVDTYGMAVLEAMSAKLPVIVSNKKYCGFAEHLNDDQALILDNPKDKIELSKKINLIFSDIKFRELIAMKGFKKSQSISWENTLEKTLLAYNIVLENNRNDHEG